MAQPGKSACFHIIHRIICFTNVASLPLFEYYATVSLQTVNEALERAKPTL